MVALCDHLSFPVDSKPRIVLQVAQKLREKHEEVEASADPDAVRWDAP